MPVHSSGFVSHLAGPLLPEEPLLPDEVRRRVQQDVGVFLEKEMQLMPVVLRISLGSLLWVFRLGCWVRWGRSFQGIEVLRQRTYLASWSHSRFFPFQNLVKVFRSCALIQYWDHPVVLRALGVQDE